MCTASLFSPTATTEIYTLSLHDALPIWAALGEERGEDHITGERQLARVLLRWRKPIREPGDVGGRTGRVGRSEEHTSELQSLRHLVCRLLLEKKKQKRQNKCDEHC